MWTFGVADQLVDGHHLARLRVRQQFRIMIAPPRRGVAAEGAAGEFRIAARARRDVEDAHFQHVAGLRVLDGDRSCADVHAEAFAGAAAVDRGVHRAGAAAVDALFVTRPAEHALRAEIADDHAFGIVGGMLGERLDGDGVAGFDFDDRPERKAEIAPMHMRRRDRQVVMLPRCFRCGCVARAIGCRTRQCVFCAAAAGA